MSEKIFVYRGEGADPFCIGSLCSSLKESGHSVDFVGPEDFRDSFRGSPSDLLIFPGGRDLPYLETLQGEPNRRIREFIRSGGVFLGICAGAYYGSRFVDFERGGPLQVLGERELAFFPGVAKGPAYGLGRFSYSSPEGALIAKLSLSDSSRLLVSYYNGGCFFEDPEKHSGVSILARYSDIEGMPAAVIECSFGKGKALLSGVHPEYSLASEAEEQMRKELFRCILSKWRGNG